MYRQERRFRDTIDMVYLLNQYGAQQVMIILYSFLKLNHSSG